MIKHIDKGALAELLIREIEKLDQDENRSIQAKIIQIGRILDYLFTSSIASERIHFFPTLFSKISFVGLRHKFSRKIIAGIAPF